MTTKKCVQANKTHFQTLFLIKYDQYNWSDRERGTKGGKQRQQQTLTHNKYSNMFYISKNTTTFLH